MLFLYFINCCRLVRIAGAAKPESHAHHSESSLILAHWKSLFVVIFSGFITTYYQLVIYKLKHVTWTGFLRTIIMYDNKLIDHKKLYA
jgi:hypothetical protein